MSMQHRLLCFALTLVAAAPAGCEEPISCTAEARTSVVLTITDAETGEEVEEATVTVLIDGEESNEVETFGSGRYLLGVERDGTFEVTVSAAGYESVTNEYEVTADECHVTTVEDAVALVPSP
jgi:hypothetical protein